MMCISNNCKLAQTHYLLNNSRLESIGYYKYLGIKISLNLSWREHIIDTCIKATRVLNILRRTMYGCTLEARAKVYTALVYPHLETCAPVWSPHDRVAREELEKVQRRALRWICRAKWDRDAHKWSLSTEECHAKFDMLSVQQRHFLLSCVQVCKIVKHLDCINFDNYFTFNSSITRCASSSLNVLPSCINSYRYSFCTLPMEYTS